MSEGSPSSIRLFLSPGTKVSGRRDTYVTGDLICMSARSVTVSCRTSSGVRMRLKFFNGENGVTEEMQERIVSCVASGVIVPQDFGTYAGRAFYVFPLLSVTDTGKAPVPLRLLLEKLIPGMAYILAFYHSRRILLRDIRPEHILYQPENGKFAFCGLGNAVGLAERATATKASGFGQEAEFVAPETEKYGYSMASDYYALGVTLLTIILGKNPLSSIPRNHLAGYLAAGKFGYISRSDYEGRSYRVMSEQDKVNYLILGLLDPDPASRWGYGELRCFCHGQEIPLKRKDGRIWYQYYHPFSADGQECWNRKQLVKTLAASKSLWTEDTAKRLSAFLKEQEPGAACNIGKIAGDKNLSEAGKMFHILYTLDPGLDGLWWKGIRFCDSAELAEKCAGIGYMEKQVSQMLRDHCLSLFLTQRGRTSRADPGEAQIRLFEEYELQEEKKGVSRLFLYFRKDPKKRTFSFCGNTYADLSELLSDRMFSGMKLRNKTSELFREKSFQAWLWAAGFDETVWSDAAGNESGSDESYYLLMKIAEKTAKNKKSAELARDRYLRYGDYAPLLWLHENMRHYRAVSVSAGVLFSAIRNADLGFGQPLEQLLQKAEGMLLDYQMFVAGMKSTVELLPAEALRYTDFSYCTGDPECLFNHTWKNGMEVCHRFLKDIGDDGTA